MKNLNHTSFPNRAVKTFSVATHLFRGIILFTRKSLRWGTSDSMKLCTRDNVWFRIQKPIAIGQFRITRYQDFWDKSLGWFLGFQYNVLHYQNPSYIGVAAKARAAVTYLYYEWFSLLFSPNRPYADSFYYLRCLFICVYVVMYVPSRNIKSCIRETPNRLMRTVAPIP